MFYNIRTPLYLCLLFAIISMTPLTTQAQNKDSSYYLSDDGIFSDEEKDAEAEIIKQRCEIGTLTRIYYNCTCIAGTFRQKRDEPELTPQAHIKLLAMLMNHVHITQNFLERVKTMMKNIANVLLIKPPKILR